MFKTVYACHKEQDSHRSRYTIETHPSSQVNIIEVILSYEKALHKEREDWS